jgi:hypothetical protein
MIHVPVAEDHRPGNLVWRNANQVPAVSGIITAKPHVEQYAGVVKAIMIYNFI